jgi:D-serine deaminase-like pyridoxal phosphate-dependent protein
VNYKMEIVRPTLVLNKTKCLQNIELMVEKAKRHKLTFRPHFKTHQSAEVGNWFRQFDVDKITVSSVSMAHYFVSNEWKNITIAIPFNILEIPELDKFPPDCILNIVVDSPETANAIGKTVNRNLGVYIKISTGYERTGIEYASIPKIDELIFSINRYSNLKFIGFLTHTGHTYMASSKYEVQNIHYDSLKKMFYLKEYFSPDYPELEISIGDTPSCSISENFMGVSEIRPGNFVFYDLMQHYIGACNIDDIALRMHCPVISRQPLRNEVVIYGGAIHFSKDFITNTDGKNLYGRVVIKKDDEQELLDTTNYLSRLTQEHGVVRLNPSIFRQINIGDILEIIPVHACLTAYSMGRYVTNKGDIIEMMPRF